jgi:predicted deacetylase
MSTLVSIHDVSPAWSVEVEAALALCAEFGIRPALLVVPDLHGHAPILASGPFCRRLRDAQRAGHEIHLHGLYHEAGPRPDGGGLRRRLGWYVAQRLLSAGEAEFAHLPESDGMARIAEGERILREAGLAIDGFVAPAWAMPPWLLGGLAHRGYRFTEDHLRVYDPAGRRSRASVVLNWASRSPMRMASTVAWCRAARWARPLVPARLAIHPADMRIAWLRREIRSSLAWARGDTVDRGSTLLA